MAFFVHFPAHEKGHQIVVNAEPLIDLVQISIFALHEQVDFFLGHHHLHQIGLQAPGVGQEVDVLELRGGVADKAHIELAHTGIVKVQFRYNDFVDVLKVDAGRQALLGTEQNAISTLPQCPAQGAAFGEGGGTACDHKQGTVRQVFLERCYIGIQYILVPHADGHNLVIPLGCHLYSLPDFYRGTTFVLSQGVRRGADPEQECDLLHQFQPSVLSRIAGRGKIVPPDLLKLFHHLLVHGPLLWSKGNRNLLDTADFLTCDFLKSPGNDCLCQNVIQNISIVDVLGALSNSKYRGFFRQMTGGEQRVSWLVGRNWLAIVGIAVMRHYHRSP